MKGGYFLPEVFYRTPNADRSDAILRYIGNRVLNNNKNFLCAVTGQTGSGKSWACVGICEKYSKLYGIPFDVKVHTIHTLKQLLLLIKNKELEKNIQVGTPLIFEEPQATDANSRNWQSDANKMLAVLLSTFRNQRLVVFFSTPFLHNIDKQSRTLFHGEFKISSFDKNTKISRIKPRFIEFNGDYDKFYKKKLIVYYAREGKRHYGMEKVASWEVPKASDKLLDEYEAIKAKFSVDLVNKLFKELEKSEKSEEKDTKEVDYLSIFNKIKQIYIDSNGDYAKILEEMPNISPRTLETYLSMIKKATKYSPVVSTST